MTAPQWIIEDLTRSGLTPETFPVTPLKSKDELMHRLGFSKMGEVSIFEIGGYWIEYPSTEGFYRLKLKEPISDAKYLSPKGARNHAFTPPGVLEIAKEYKPDQPIHFTEGEKKATKAILSGFPCIGLSGVWCFKDSEHEFLPELAELNLKHRKCFICFDSDITKKINVKHAELRLSVELINRGAIPLCVRLPNETNGEKNGLDDYLVKYRVEDFKVLINEALDPFELHLSEGTPLQLILKEASRIKSDIEKESIVKKIAQFKKITVDLVRSELIKYSSVSENNKTDIFINSKRKLHPAMDLIDGELAYGIPYGKDPQFISNHKLIKFSEIQEENVIENYPQQLKFSHSGIKKYINKEEFDPTQLYKNIRELFENHIIFQFDWQIDLTVIWVMGSYLYRCFPLYPYYWIKSPTKRCGKTRLLEIMAALCFNSNGIETAPSAAVLYRLPNITAGTLLWDEAGHLGKQKDRNELISILNTAYRRDGKISRCEGNDHEVKFYSVYRPVALAGIHNLPDTVEDRSLKVELVRKKRSEKVKKLQIERNENDLEKLRDGLHIFALENSKLIREAYSDFDDSIIPEEVDDRLRDALEVIMSVAAGILYHDPDFNLISVLKTAAESLSGIRNSDEDEISFIRAVNILKTKIDSSKDDYLILKSEDAVELFSEGGIEWVIERKHASSILRNLGFRSESHRPGEDVIRGYKITKEKITDLYLRYGSGQYNDKKSVQSVTN